MIIDFSLILRIIKIKIEIRNNYESIGIDRIVKKTESKKEKISSSLPLDSYLKVKFEVYGEEIISKQVKRNGLNCGRVYLPPQWVGKNVKLVRID